MKAGRKHGGARAGAGFTLLELLAVMVLLALLASLTYPRLTQNRERETRREAQILAERLAFARQRALITGRPHRLQLDLTAASHHLEWLPPAAPATAPEGGEGTKKRLSISPPPPPDSTFAVVPGPPGRRHRAPTDAVRFELDAAGKRDTKGTYTLSFAADGRSDAARITARDVESEAGWVVELRALSDVVPVFREKD